MKGSNFFCLLALLFLLGGCTGHKQQNGINLSERRSIIQEIENMKSHFPICSHDQKDKANEVISSLPSDNLIASAPSTT